VWRSSIGRGLDQLVLYVVRRLTEIPLAALRSDEDTKNGPQRIVKDKEDIKEQPTSRNLSATATRVL
jgi:hypothetical protein